MRPVAISAASCACHGCLRRGWLLGVLSPALDYRCAEPSRLIELLALADEQLLSALAGSRRATLTARYEQFDAERLPAPPGVETICRHGRGYPSTLRDPGAPPMLNVLGGADRLAELLGRPAVALVGSSKASDYGVEMAKSLGRGLAASGVTVVSGLTDGVAVAAHVGALEVNAAGVAVIGGGLDVGCPARMRSLLAQFVERGCAASELPHGCDARRWGTGAAERIVGRLADVTVVVEAGESPRELAGASIARSLGHTVAALPGRVTSPMSRGANELLREGAPLVRGARDVLELLHAPSPLAPAREGPVSAQLEPRLVEVLEQVATGRDTPGKLAGRCGDAGDILLALSQLELMGLLARGDGGRYVPRDFLRPPSAR